MFGVTYMLAFIYFGLIKLNFTWLSDPNSPHAFADEEMRRFDVSHRLPRLKDKMPYSTLCKCPIRGLTGGRSMRNPRSAFSNPSRLR
jgi:hypothetical protein